MILIIVKKRLNYSNLSNTNYSKGLYLVNLRQIETLTKKCRENIPNGSLQYVLTLIY